MSFFLYVHSFLYLGPSVLTVFVLFFTVSTLRMAPRPAEAPWTGPRPRQVSSYRTFPSGGKVFSTGATRTSRCRLKACLETPPSPRKGKSCVDLLMCTCVCVCLSLCVRACACVLVAAVVVGVLVVAVTSCSVVLYLKLRECAEYWAFFCLLLLLTREARRRGP